MGCALSKLDNFVKQLGDHFEAESSLYKQFMNCIDHIEDEDELTSLWFDMLAEHKLEENTWLRSLFELRQSGQGII